MKSTRIYNLKSSSKNEQIEFFNSISSSDNLITAYMISNNKTSQIHNQNERGKLKKRIVKGKKTLGLGNLTCLI